MNHVVSTHEFEGESLDARCIRTHTQGGHTERCTMTRAYLHEAPEADVGKSEVPWTGWGTFQRSEWEEIQKDLERTRLRAWNAIVGVCTA
jgi:hypothetical protein